MGGLPSELPSFDVMKIMAQNEPEALEKLRTSLVQEIISSARTPEARKRLEGLEFVMQMKKRRARNSLQRCLIIYELMWDSAIEMAETTRRYELTELQALPRELRASVIRLASTDR